MKSPRMNLIHRVFREPVHYTRSGHAGIYIPISRSMRLLQIERFLRNFNKIRHFAIVGKLPTKNLWDFMNAIADLFYNFRREKRNVQYAMRKLWNLDVYSIEGLKWITDDVNPAMAKKKENYLLATNNV